MLENNHKFTAPFSSSSSSPFSSIIILSRLHIKLITIIFPLSLFVSDVMIINTVILSSSPRPSSSSVQRDPTPPFFATRSFFPFCQVPPPLFRSLSFVVRMTPSLSSHLRLPIMSKLRFFFFRADYYFQFESCYILSSCPFLISYAHILCFSYVVRFRFWNLGAFHV